MKRSRSSTPSPKRRVPQPSLLWNASSATTTKPRFASLHLLSRTRKKRRWPILILRNMLPCTSIAAKNNFSRALALDPGNEDAHVGLASAQIALNDLEGARSELDSALRDTPTPDAYIALGQLNMKENKLDAANEAVTQALRIEPGNTAALQLKQQLAAKLNSASRNP